ncbi:hypothetical protein NKH18_37055 [Streptomyces sp. M10(2022)]
MTVIHIPGSKSVTARALFLAAAANGTTTLVRPLFSDDTEGFSRATSASPTSCTGRAPWCVRPPTRRPSAPPAR